MNDIILDERARAEDILLGALGFGETAHILEVLRCDTGYRGHGRFEDGELFDFESEEELDDIQRWALKVLGVDL